MNKETVDLLKGLADKLGTTAEHLWAVLIRQAYVSFATDLVLYALLIVWLSLCYRLVRQWLEKASECKKGQKHSFEDNGQFKYELGAVLIVSLSFLLCLIAAFVIPDTITKIVNPEFWALQQILETVKGVK